MFCPSRLKFCPRLLPLLQKKRFATLLKFNSPAEEKMNRVPSVLMLLVAAGATSAEETGAIHVRGESGLEVWLDGEHRGFTKGDDGLRLDDVEPGRHLLKVLRADFQPRVTWVEVKAGAVATYEPPGFEPPLISRSADDLVFQDDDLNTARLAVELLPMNCRVDCETLDLSDFVPPGGCWILEGIPVGEHRIRFASGTESVEYVRNFNAREEVCLRVDPAAGSVLETRESPVVRIKETCRTAVSTEWSFLGFMGDDERFWVVGPSSLDTFSLPDGKAKERYLLSVDEACARAFHVTKDGSKVLSGRSLGRTRRWDTLSGTEDATGGVSLEPSGWAWDVSRDAGLFAQWKYNRIEVWNLDHGTLLWSTPADSGWGETGFELAFSEDDRFLYAAGGRKLGLEVFETRSGARGETLQFGKVLPVRMFPSGNGEHVAILCTSGELKIWSPSAGRVLHTLPVDKSAQNLVERNGFPPALSSTGLLLFAAGTERRLELWDYRTGRRLQTLLDPAAGRSRAVFSPDGKRLLIVGGTEKPQVTVYDVER